MPSLLSVIPKIGDTVWWCLDSGVTPVTRSAKVLLPQDDAHNVVVRNGLTGRYALLNRLTEVFTTEREAVEHKLTAAIADRRRDLANLEEMAANLKSQKKLLVASLKRLETALAAARAKASEEPTDAGGDNA